MALPTERLIDRLVAEATPVRRLRPPALRAALWLLAVAAVASLGIALFANPATVLRRFAQPTLEVELAGTLLTGITAILAAFHLSLPDRSRRWGLLPLPFLALWLGASSWGCWRHWAEYGPDGWVLGESADCFRFILGVSVPLALVLMPLLRRARPLSPMPVALTGGLGVAAIAAFVLQFFHPFDVTFLDLGSHLAAVAIVVAVWAAAGRLMPR